MKTTLEILTAARELISVPERWTQGSFAKTNKGRTIGAGSTGAVCWCSEGAIRKVSGYWPDDFNAVEYTIAFNLLGQVVAETSLLEGIVKYNDTHTHAEVLAVFDSAIDKAKGELNA